MKIAAKMIPVLVRERRVLMLREAKYDGGNNTGLWDVPGGGVEGEETLIEAMRREAREEAGLELPKVLTDFLQCYVTQQDKLRIFVPVPFWMLPKVTLGPDHDEAIWFTRNGMPGKEQCMPGLYDIIQKVLGELK